MSAIQTLEAVAELLPPDRRERFLKLAVRFRNVPEDDEYLLILEAIGFMTLVWEKIPAEVLRVLEGANPVSETCESVASKIRDAVVEAIPSYDDLKQITQRLEAHELALIRISAMDHTDGSRKKYPSMLWILTASMVGAVAGFMAQDLLPYLVL